MRAMRRVDRVSAAVGTGTLAVLLVACGSSSEGAADGADSSPSASASVSADSVPTGDPTLEPYERVAAAPDAAADAGTVRVELEIVTTTAGESLTVTSEGFSDEAAGSSRLTTELPVPGMDPIRVETVVVDGLVYLGGMPHQPAGTWLRVPAEEADQFGVDASSSNPAQSLELMRGVGDGVTEVGTERLRGVEVTRYAGTIHVTTALQAMTPSQAELIGPLFEDSGITVVPFELSLDGQGRPARLTQTLALVVEGEAVMTETTLDFFDWGSDIAITAPDPAQVIEAPVPTA